MGNIQPKEYYNKAYTERAGYSKQYTESEYYELWKIVLKILEHLVSQVDYKNGAVLELGCGTGQFAQMLYDNDYKNYLGVDFSDKAIDMASKVDMKFKLYDALKIDQLNYRYDIILALEFFEHTHDLKVISLLKSKTPIIFTLPDFGDPAHERYFKSEAGVRDYYSGMIDFKSIQKFDKYFICNGVVH